MRISGRFVLAASLAGVFTLAGCTGTGGPSEKQMHAALVKSANTLGGQLENPQLQSAIGQCKGGAAQVTDENGQTMDCKMLCGEKAGECDLSVKITEFKKTKCTQLTDQKGVFECNYTMVASSPSQWLNAAIHDGDAQGVPENTIPRSTRFKKDKGEWIVSQN